MDTRQVEYAIAVAEELNFTRAAKRVFAVQSTVSAGVKALEQELGVALFRRDNRSVTLTSEGEVLIPELREFLEVANRVKTAADPDGSLRGELRIGIFSSLDHFNLPALIGEFHREHPLIDLRLRPSETGSVGLAEDVLRGRLDIALFGLPATAAPGLQTHRLATSPFVALLPECHAFAERSSVSAQDLVGENFIDTPHGFGNRIVLDTALASHGIIRNVTTEVSELGPIAGFVAAGFGIALLPEVFVRPAPGAVVLPLDEDIYWELNVIMGLKPSAAATALCERLTRGRTEA